MTPVKILIIDDNEVDRELIRAMLELNEYSVTELGDATSCMKVIATEKPDLVLLDIMMPGFDGNQLLQLIRMKYPEIKLPVIMVTSKSDASDVVESLNLGANDYITKPIQFDIALRRIQIHLTMAVQSRLLSRAKELEATNAMLRTLAHEINNPLTVALGTLSQLNVKYGTDSEFSNLEQSLWQIADVVNKSKEILQKAEVSLNETTGE